MCAGLSDYPLFLHHKWFYPGNASKLREHIRYLLLKLFVEQVPEVQLQNRADALAEAHQDITRYEEGPDRCQFDTLLKPCVPCSAMLMCNA